MSQDINLLATLNMLALREHSYPGRGMVLGKTQTGELAQVYFVTGRSPASQNRRLVAENDCRVYTQVANPEQPAGDPKLTLYDAMNENGRHFVVSNGEQTDAVVSEMVLGYTLSDSLRRFKYELDAHFTPRITGIFSLDSVGKETPFLGLYIIRKSLWDDDSCERIFGRYDSVAPGFGLCITTYAGDGNPLPAFTDDPLLMPLTGDIDAIANTYWQALNPLQRVALAVKTIPLVGPSKVKIINRF